MLIQYIFTRNSWVLSSIRFHKVDGNINKPMNKHSMGGGARTLLWTMNNGYDEVYDSEDCKCVKIWIDQCGKGVNNDDNLNNYFN